MLLSIVLLLRALKKPMYASWSDTSSNESDSTTFENKRYDTIIF